MSNERNTSPGHDLELPKDAMVSVGRAFSVLRLISGASQRGLRLSDISSTLGLHKASVSRMLSTLIALGAIERDRNHFFRVSDGFRSALGTPLSTTRLRQAARPVLGVLSETLEDVAFLSVPNGLDSLCVARCIGAYPIQALSLNVGGRRPLGVGAGSLALLAWEPDGEREDLVEMQRERLDDYHVEIPQILDAILQSRSQGYTDLPGFVVQGMTGMGVPIRDPSGLVVAALSVAAMTERLSGERRELAVETLKLAASNLEARLRTGGVCETDPSERSA